MSHSKRGPKKYYYTYQKLADITGISLAGVKKAAARGELRMGDMLSVAKWLISHDLMRGLKQDSKSVSTEVFLLPEIIEVDE